MLMQELKEQVDDIMYQIKNDEIDESTKNLLTGLGILFLVLIFSIWYFYTPAAGRGTKNLYEDIKKESSAVIEKVTTSKEDSPSGIEEVQIFEEDAIVQPGEGLWTFAERVCGDGESYNYIADANNLNIHWSQLEVGQELKVVCGPEAN